MRYHLYVARPIPADGSRPVLGYDAITERDTAAGFDYLWIGPYEGAERAVNALLFHAERYTLGWPGRGGWPTGTPTDGTLYELGKATLRTRRPLARIHGDLFTATRKLADLLPGRALDCAVIHYTNHHTTLTGRSPLRVPTLTRTVNPGDYLPPAQLQGATA